MNWLYIYIHTIEKWEREREREDCEMSNKQDKVTSDIWEECTDLGNESSPLRLFGNSEEARQPKLM